MGGLTMTIEKIPSVTVNYEIDNRTISLDDSLVTKFSELICPITETFLRFQIKIFGNRQMSDEILSKKISLDMANELNGYE